MDTRGIVALVVFDERPGVEHHRAAVGGGHLHLNAGPLAAAWLGRSGLTVGVVGLDLGQPGASELGGDPRVAPPGGAEASKGLGVLSLCGLVVAVIG